MHCILFKGITKNYLIKKTVFNRFVFKLIHSSFKNQNTCMNKSILTRACRTFFLTNCFFTVIINCFKIMIIHVYFVNLHFAFQKFCSRLSFIIGIHLIVFQASTGVQIYDNLKMSGNRYLKP